MAQPSAAGPAADALRQLRRAFLLALAIAVLLMAGWAAMAPLSGAVVASGIVKAEHNRKVIQHQEGGIVSAIAVKEGQAVRAGDLLAVIGDVRTDASLDMLSDQQAAEAIRRARLEAEVAFAGDFSLSGTVRSHRVAADIVARERKIFQARRSTLSEQVQALEAQIREVQRQTEGLQAQIVSTENGLKLAREELVLNEQLEKQGYIQKARLLTLNRVVEDYQGRMGQQRGDLSEARQKIEDLRLRMAQARNAYQQQAADELKESALRLREIDERLRPSRDVAARQEVRAPVAGTVMSLRLSAVGTAVGPREPLMELVPADEPLVVEAHVRPEDIDHVHPGGAAEVRLSAYDPRAVPRLAARVSLVSADRVYEQSSGASWYVAQLRVDDVALRDLPQVRLQAGMPVEVYVATRPRSLLAYLAEPLDAFRQRALREP